MLKAWKENLETELLCIIRTLQKLPRKIGNLERQVDAQVRYEAQKNEEDHKLLPKADLSA